MTFAQSPLTLKIVNNTTCPIGITIFAHDGSGTYFGYAALSAATYTQPALSNTFFTDIDCINFCTGAPTWLLLPGPTWWATDLINADWDYVHYDFGFGVFGNSSNGSGTTATGSLCGSGTVTWQTSPTGWDVIFN